jgi:L-galactose dehydrogenase
MEYRELGRTGLSVSVVSYGTAPLGDMFGTADEDQALASVRQALDAGITFFDSSPFYGGGLAEERLGRALAGHRNEVIIGTKAGRYGRDEFDFSARRIRDSVETSLRLLRTDHVDLLQLHDIEYVDLAGPFGEGYEELVSLREQGKCRFMGMTGYPIETFRRAMIETDLDVVLCYAHATLLDQSLITDLLPMAEDRGVGMINAAAVSLGLLTPKGSVIEHPADQVIKDAAARVVQLCRERGVDVAFLANQFSIQRSRCPTTVIGTTKPQHLESALAAVEEPIDEELLADVLDVVGAARNRAWASGLPENN